MKEARTAASAVEAVALDATRGPPGVHQRLAPSRSSTASLVVGFGNGLILGYLMYRSAFEPPRMAILGLIGGPTLIISFVLILFGAYDNGSGPSFLMALPEIAWEASLPDCAWKGFRPSPIAETEMAVGEV